MTAEHEKGTADPETWDCIIDNEADIDWHKVLITTDTDFRAARYAFTTAFYPSHEEAMTAMHALVHSIFEEAKNRVESDTSLDTHR